MSIWMLLNELAVSGGFFWPVMVNNQVKPPLPAFVTGQVTTCPEMTAVSNVAPVGVVTEPQSAELTSASAGNVTVILSFTIKVVTAENPTVTVAA